MTEPTLPPLPEPVWTQDGRPIYLDEALQIAVETFDRNKKSPRLGALVRAMTIERAELQERVRVLEADAARYRWLCERLGVTELPTLIERITKDYVGDYKPAIDAAIDAARSNT